MVVKLLQLRFSVVHSNAGSTRITAVKLSCNCLPSSILYDVALGISYQCQILSIQNLVLCVTEASWFEHKMTVLL